MEWLIGFIQNTLWGKSLLVCVFILLIYAIVYLIFEATERSKDE